MKLHYYYIKEKSRLAKVAARVLKSPRAAIVVGQTIYLYGVDKIDFLLNYTWLRHEICHIKQYRRYTAPLFLLRYAWECVLHGYQHNRFETEARAAEHDKYILNNIILKR